MEEVGAESLKEFRTLNEFFTRELKPGLRPIENFGDLGTVCCPCDGEMVMFGDIEGTNEWLDEVKGKKYHLD